MVIAWAAAGLALTVLIPARRPPPGTGTGTQTHASSRGPCRTHQHSGVRSASGVIVSSSPAAISPAGPA